MLEEFVMHIVMGIIFTIVLGLCIIGMVALFHHHIGYGWAFLIAGVLVFSGFLVIEGDWIE